MRKALLAIAVMLSCLPLKAQIVNRLGVDRDIFMEYASHRMQQYNPGNLATADSLYALGESRGDYRLKCLGLSLRFPVQFALGDYGGMDESVSEMKSLLISRKDVRAFYFSTLHEYCQYLVHTGRAEEAMLEARAMGRMANEEKRPLGKMYSYRIIGLIHSYRNNPHLAIRNFTKAADLCKEARAEQDLPNLYILIAQEYVKTGELHKAGEYCTKAEEYRDFFPTIRLKALMTRAVIAESEGDMDGFRSMYETLVRDPMYLRQMDSDSRYGMDISYLMSLHLFEQALCKADSLSQPITQHASKHGIYAAMGSYPDAYGQLGLLMTLKDSIYIKVQNEDLAILDAEMNNAALRAEAQRLEHRNQNTILLGFLVMFALAFISILVSQWQLRENLEELARKNGEMLRARRAYQQALDAKESENEMKIKILQNRKSNTIKL